MNILVLDFNGMGLREISIKGISMIFYISVGHDSKIYVADGYGKLFSIEDETGNVRQATSPESGNSMSKLVMKNPTVYTHYQVILSSTKLSQVLNSTISVQSALTKTALSYS
jgi:hypothetical protein